MKLHLLFEDNCRECKKELTADDIEPLDRSMRCSACKLRNKKKLAGQDSEERNKQEREKNFNTNLTSVSQQMPDRGHDQNRGTPGWLMGEPSPGRSF